MTPMFLPTSPVYMLHDVHYWRYVSTWELMCANDNCWVGGVG